MTPLEMLVALRNEKADVQLHAWAFTAEVEWCCTIEAKDGDIKLEIKTVGATPEAAIREAYRKFIRVLDHGAPELHRTALSAPPEPDDVISF